MKILFQCAYKIALLLLPIGTSVTLVSCHPEQKLYSEELSRTAMELWPDSFNLREPGKPVKWSYDQGVILKGIEGVWRETGDKQWFDYIRRQMDFYVQEDGSILRYRPGEYNIDHVNNGKVLLMLYQETGE